MNNSGNQDTFEHANLVFTGWTPQLSLKLKELILQITEDDPEPDFDEEDEDEEEEDEWEAEIDQEPDLELQYSRFTGSVDEIVERIGRWIEEEVPGRMQALLTHPVICEHITEPQYIYTIFCLPYSCLIGPQWTIRQKIPLGKDCHVTRVKDTPGWYLLQVPNKTGWAVEEKAFINYFTLTDESALEQGRLFGFTLTPEMEQQVLDSVGKVDEMLELLQTGGTFDRIVALRALGKSKDPRVITSLLAILEDTVLHPAIRAAAAEALGDTGDGRATEPLLDIVTNGPKKDRDHYILDGAMAGLKKISDSRTAELFFELAQSTHHDDPRWLEALVYLVERNDVRVVSILAAILHGDEDALPEELAEEREAEEKGYELDATSNIRVMGGLMLAGLDIPGALLPLLDALANGDDLARLTAAVELAKKTGNFSGMDQVLTRYAKSGELEWYDGTLLYELLQVLGKSSDRRAIPFLIEALTIVDADYEDAIPEKAAAALHAITEQDFGADCDRWLAWWEKQRTE